jgi:HK97 family phage major capsid protein
MLTTIRKARTALENKGETATAWVFNPADLEALDLMRENGVNGGFLLDSAAADTVFGPGIARVSSLAVPAGTALLGDFQKIRLRVRQGAHTLAATQAGDLFDKNLVKLRGEGRYGVDVARPQAFAVVHLTA